MLISNGISFSGGVTITAPIPITYLTDPYYYNTVLHLNGETPTPIWIADASTVTNAITTSGNVVPSRFSPILPQGYYSNQFDGSTGYLTFAPGNLTKFGTNNFTFEAWVYFTSAQNLQYLFDARDATNTTAWAFVWGGGTVSNGQLEWYNGSSSLVVDASTTDFGTNVWNHVAYVRNGSVGTIYKNGIAVSSATDTTNYTVSGVTNYIGSRYNSSAGTLFTGYISNLRIVNGTALYTSNFTPSTVPLTAATSQTSLLTCLGPSFTDYANNFPITVAGTVKVQTFQPFGALPSTVSNPTNGYYSNYFNGSSYFGVASLPIFAFGTNNFTVEVWVNLTSFTNVRFIEGITGTGGLELSFNSTGNVTWGKYGVGNILTSTTPITLNTWYHVAVVRTNSITAIYINGVASGFIGDTYSYPQTAIRVGADAGPTYYFNGQMSNLRIVNGTALYTNNFTVPSQPLTVVNSTQTSLLTGLNQQLSDASGYANTLTNSGVVVTSISPFTVPTTTTNVISYGSGLFDGSSGYLSGNGALTNGAVAVTIECWFYLTGSYSGWAALFSNMSVSAGSGFQVGINVSGVPSFSRGNGGNGTVVAGSTAVSLYTWYHVAFVRTSSGAMTVYLNGVSVATGSDSGLTGTTKWVIGNGYYDTPGNYWPGYISNLRIVSGAALYTSNFAPSNQPLTVATNTTGTTVLLTLQNRQSNNNNIFYDDSPNNFAITRAGTPTQGSFTPFSQNGWSNYFDGSTGKLTFSSLSSMSLSGQFTIECWVYWTGSTTYYQNFIGSNDTFTSNASYFRVWGTSSPSNANKIGIGNPTHDGASAVYSTNNLVPNTWNHVAATRDSSNIIRVFINGNLEKTGSTDSSLYNFGQGGTCIGDSPWDGSNGWYSGYISNLRVINGAAIYTASFTSPTLALTTATGTTGTVSLLTAQSNRFLDNSTYSNTLTVTGSVQVIPYSPFANQSLVSNSYSTTLVGGSMYFNGSTDYLSYSGIVIGANAFTIEFWFYANNFTNTVAPFGTGNNNGLSVRISPTTTQFTIDSFGTSNTSFTVPAMSTNTWYHVAVVRNSSNATTIFLNGVRSTTGAVTVTTNFSGISNWIGYFGSGYYFPGYISNMRVITGTSIYDPTQSTITVPTTIPNAVAYVTSSTTASTSLLLLGTNSGIVDQTGRNDLISVGTATISASTFKNGVGSLSFGGNNYTSSPYSPAWILAGNFTIECWLYWSAHGSYGGIVGSANNNTGAAISAGWYLDFNSTNNTIQFEGQGSVAVVSTNPIPQNQWVHIAVVRSGSTITHFLNGVPNGSGTSSQVFNSASYPLYVGVDRGVASYLTGYIDDLRITNGTARYSTSTSFTPPLSQPVQ